jgi:hypothetical protein
VQMPAAPGPSGGSHFFTLGAVWESAVSRPLLWGAGASRPCRKVAQAPCDDDRKRTGIRASAVQSSLRGLVAIRGLLRHAFRVGDRRRDRTGRVSSRTANHYTRGIL